MNNADITIRQAVQFCEKQLTLNDSLTLISAALQCSRATCYAHPEKKLTPPQITRLHDWVARCVQGEPIAYILGHQPFWALDLTVTPDTLIPRPETECLVEWILQHYPPDPPLSLLDLGTGTGAIALALHYERPLWNIEATDDSLPALEVARENSRAHDMQGIRFYHGDWYQALPAGRRYHIIVSNPPYIQDYDPHLHALRYEPRSALVAEKNGLAALEHIITTGPAHLYAGGVIVVEHGYDQPERVRELLIETGYDNIAMHCDYAQQPRFATATWRIS